MQNPEMTKKTITAADALKALLYRTANNLPASFVLSTWSSKGKKPQWTNTTHIAQTKRRLSNPRMRSESDLPDLLATPAEPTILAPSGLGLAAATLASPCFPSTGASFE